jgi:hypothetical protein
MQLEPDIDLPTAIKQVKGKIRQIRRLPSRGLGYGILKYLAHSKGLSFHPRPEINFNYLGQFTQDGDLMVGTFDDIGELAWDHSILSFESESDKRQREHLQRLFALGVEFPWLEPVIRQLIKLPHNAVVDNLFWLVHKLHKGYAIYHRVHPVDANTIELFKTAMHFMKINS